MWVIRPALTHRGPLQCRWCGIRHQDFGSRSCNSWGNLFLLKCDSFEKPLPSHICGLRLHMCASKSHPHEYQDSPFSQRITEWNQHWQWERLCVCAANFIYLLWFNLYLTRKSTLRFKVSSTFSFKDRQRYSLDRFGRWYATPHPPIAFVCGRGSMGPRYNSLWCYVCPDTLLLNIHKL